MAREFIIGEGHAGSNLNRRYYFDFKHIAGNSVNTVYVLYRENAGKYDSKERQTISKCIKSFRDDIRPLLKDMETETAIDLRVADFIRDFCKMANTPGTWDTEKLEDLVYKIREFDVLMKALKFEYP